MWHCSIARQPRNGIGGPLPMARWTPRDAAKARELAYLALRGVGDSKQEHWEYGDIALHLRRACTPEEIAGLPAGTVERRIAMGMAG